MHFLEKTPCSSYSLNNDIKNGSNMYSPIFSGIIYIKHIESFIRVRSAFLIFKEITNMA